jgi:serine/threonine protein kinase
MPSTLTAPAGRIPPGPGIPGSRLIAPTILMPDEQRSGPAIVVPGPPRIVAAATIPRAGGQGGALRSPGQPDHGLLGRAQAPALPGGNSMIGRVIGERYGVIALIGEGGMGEVYEAKHLAMGRLVAIKVLNPTRAQDTDAVSRLRHEARVAGTLGHPNICAIYDMGRLDDGSPYLVMERLQGETLAQRLLREARVPVDELVDIVVQILSALTVAHQRGIIHRDLKPDNIFLAQRDGLRPIPKLLDFGISKSEDLEETMADLTGHMVAAGTPFYMAPEQARGDRVDHRVDLWATGIMLYECLSGQRPFDARNYNALLVQILTAAPRPLREVQPNVPAGLELIVERALVKAPEGRYQSAQELQSALRSVNLTDGTTSKMPAKRQPIASEPPGSNDDPDATFVFSRSSMGLQDGEPISVRGPIIPTPAAPPVIEAPPVTTPPEFSETDTTGVYLPYTDDDEHTTIDDPHFLGEGSATSSHRDTIPMPPRKE